MDQSRNRTSRWSSVRGADFHIRIREVWIVDLTTDMVFVQRSSSGEGYGSVVPIKAPAVLDVERLPGVTIAVAEVFASD